MDARECEVDVFVIRVKRASEGFIKREIIEREAKWTHFCSHGGVDIFSSFSLGRPSTENSPSFYLPSYTYTRTMSDHEVETFESTDAGASKTVPMQAGSVRKGGYIVIKGKACKVLFTPRCWF